MIATVSQNSVLKNNMLSRNPAGLSKSYRTAITITDSDRETTVITYHVTVVCTETFQDGGYNAMVTTNQFLVNGFEPELVMEELANKCREPLETVHYSVSRNGSITGIRNHAQIVEKWFDLKTRLEASYTGENFRKYMALNEAAILNPDALLEALRKDVFINQYFYPIYEEPFFEYARKTAEHVTFFNIGYEIVMLLRLKENATLSGSPSITKTISSDYNQEAMPIERYETEYILNQDLGIVNIKGVFENYGRKYSFAISEKYV